MSVDEKQRIQEFLAELTALTYKYGLHIYGCGCCGSPGVADVEERQAGCRYSVDHNGEYLQLRSEEDIAELDYRSKEYEDDEG